MKLNRILTRKLVQTVPLIAAGLSFSATAVAVAQECTQIKKCTGRWTTVWGIIPVYEETCTLTTSCTSY
jgi:hypothetical protein